VLNPRYRLHGHLRVRRRGSDTLTHHEVNDTCLQVYVCAMIYACGRSPRVFTTVRNSFVNRRCAHLSHRRPPSIQQRSDTRVNRVRASAAHTDFVRSLYCASIPVQPFLALPFLLRLLLRHPRWSRNGVLLTRSSPTRSSACRVLS
jgi:hypothetical protein